MFQAPFRAVWRRAIFAGVLASMVLSAARLAHAQAAYPGRPTVMTVPQAVGGANDFGGPMASQKLVEARGGPVVADNWPGAGCSIGSQALADPSFSAKSVLELRALVKGKPGQYQCASAGNGTLNLLLGEMLSQIVKSSGVSV